MANKNQQDAIDRVAKARHGSLRSGSSIAYLIELRSEVSRWLSDIDRALLIKLDK